MIIPEKKPFIFTKTLNGGYKKYYLDENGVEIPHCDDGPAIVEVNLGIVFKVYFKNGKYHRLDGPAFSRYSEKSNALLHSTYYVEDEICEINGCIVSDKEFDEWKKLNGYADTLSEQNFIVNGRAINNHVCPTCKNERCNKAEKSCWLCGNLL